LEIWSQSDEVGQAFVEDFWPYSECCRVDFAPGVIDGELCDVDRRPVASRFPRCQDNDRMIPRYPSRYISRQVKFELLQACDLVNLSGFQSFYIGLRNSATPNWDYRLTGTSPDLAESLDFS
jgi:hypothetical protein